MLPPSSRPPSSWAWITAEALPNGSLASTLAFARFKIHIDSWSLLLLCVWLFTLFSYFLQSCPKPFRSPLRLWTIGCLPAQQPYLLPSISLFWSCGRLAISLGWTCSHFPNQGTCESEQGALFRIRLGQQAITRAGPDKRRHKVTPCFLTCHTPFDLKLLRLTFLYLEFSQSLILYILAHMPTASEELSRTPQVKE